MSIAHEAHRLLVYRNDLRNTCVTDDVDAHAALGLGQARLRIDSFALTANNLTYAALGDAMKYWDFFPTDNSSLGCIPVWGFATVVESRAENVCIGQRCFGFWPMGSHLVVQPTSINDLGFGDDMPHRRTLPGAYNQVQFCRSDPANLQCHESLQALLRPFFNTAFLIDDFLAEHAFLGARQILLSSASSKTAYGAALCLSDRNPMDRKLAITGLTSQANLPFTQSLGCYHQVLAYDNLGALDPHVPTVYVDMSGNASERKAVLAHFNGALSGSCAVGGKWWDQLAEDAGLRVARPTLFFTPTQLRKRANPPSEMAAPQCLQQRIRTAWARMMTAIDGAGTSPWLAVHEGHGVEAIRRAYLALIEGRANSRHGHMLSFWPRAAQA